MNKNPVLIDGTHKIAAKFICKLTIVVGFGNDEIAELRQRKVV